MQGSHSADDFLNCIFLMTIIELRMKFNWIMFFLLWLTVSMGSVNGLIHNRHQAINLMLTNMFDDKCL